MWIRQGKPTTTVNCRFVQQILTFWSYRYCGLVRPIQIRFDCWERNSLWIFDAVLYHNLHWSSQFLNLSQSLIATLEVFPLTLRPVYKYWNDDRLQFWNSVSHVNLKLSYKVKISWWSRSKCASLTPDRTLPVLLGDFIPVSLCSGSSTDIVGKTSDLSLFSLNSRIKPIIHASVSQRQPRDRQLW
jgi:hypothetical protein